MSNVSTKLFNVWTKLFNVEPLLKNVEAKLFNVEAKLFNVEALKSFASTFFSHSTSYLSKTLPHDDIHEPLRHDDDFDNLFAVRVLGNFRVGERQFFQVFV